jgi:hypothetical protein
MNPLLSILVCTINKRASLFERLDKKIRNQLTIETEYLVNLDDGKLSIGNKREELKLQSTGKYIVYIDDDDHISKNYVKNILSVIKGHEPDAIGIKCIYTVNFKQKSYFVSTNNTSELTTKGVHCRPIGHLNPVKREIAIKAPFPDLYYGEDRKYSNEIKPHIKTEVLAKNTLYWYDYRPNSSESIKKDIEVKSLGLKLIENNII